MIRLPELLKDSKNKEIYDKYSDPLFIDFIEIIYDEDLKNIMKNRDKYSTQARSKIEAIERKFNIVNIQQAFIFISNIFCFYDPPEYYTIDPLRIRYNFPGRIFYDKKFCFLPNDTGLFGLNTYLYAYFHNVYIVGVPSRYQNFDGLMNECPSVFIKHDYFHYTYINKIKSSDKDFAHRLYRIILDDVNLSPLQVQLHILVLWIIIHEIFGVNESRYYDLKWMEKEIFNLKALAVEFFEELNRFRELVIDEEIVSAYITYNPSIMPKVDIETSNSQISTFNSSNITSSSVVSNNSYLLDRANLSKPVYKQLNPEYIPLLSAYYDDKSIDINNRSMSLLKLIIFYHLYQVRLRYST